jgi:GT2 family glycosyltransferase
MPTPPTTGDAAAPELSVVIVSYACRDLLAECLASLEPQRADVHMEVVVVDNASGDGTVETVRQRFPWVVMDAAGENLGFARANNRAIRATTGRAVLILNPDTVVPPGGLRRCLDELWRTPDVGVLSPRLVDPQGRLDRRCKRGFPTLWSSICYFTGLDAHLRGPRSTAYTAGTLSEHRAGDVQAVSGAFMLMPRRVLEEVGLFDEDFFMYAEDLDLCLRVTEHGYRVRYWPGVDVVHVGGGSNVAGRRPPEANEAFFRTMAPFYRKHRPGAGGRVQAAVIWVAAEGMYLASRLGLRRLSPHTSDRDAGAGQQAAAVAPVQPLVKDDGEQPGGRLDEQHLLDAAPGGGEGGDGQERQRA